MTKQGTYLRMADDIVDKILDFIFRKNDAKYIILLLIVGFVLRSIAALNVSPNADEMLHATHAIDIIKANVLQIMDQDSVWFYLTDLGFRIFGVDMYTGRLLSIIFGTLSIVLVYLLGKKLFNGRVGLVASVIVAFSPFYLVNTLAEMDISMMFFILLSSYFFIIGLKKDSSNLFFLSVIFFGIAILVKTIAATLLPAYIIFYLVYHKRNKLTNVNTKKVIVAVIILFILVLPILSFNYLLYKDKGIVDVQFSRFLGISPEVYAGISATMKPFSVHDLFYSYENGLHKPGIYEGLRMYWKQGLVTFVLGLLGIGFALRRRKYSMLFLSLLFIFPFTFLSGTSLLPYHFVFGIPIFAILAGVFLDSITRKYSKHISLNKNHVLIVLMILVVISSFFFMNKQGIFDGKNEVTKMFDVVKDIPDDSLVIVDSRVYRGRIAWLFNDNHYLEASQLNAILDRANQLSKDPSFGDISPVPIDTYFVECLTDDCGWGNIGSDLNQSMEQTVSYVSNVSQEVATVTTSGGDPYFKVYKTRIVISPIVLNLADLTHVWFYYPVRYKIKEQIFDKYESHGFFDTALDGFAHFVLYISILIALSSIVVTFYLLYKDYKKKIR